MSPSLLASLLAPVDEDTFLAEYASKRPVHASGPTDRHEPWLSWTALDRMLNTGTLPHAALRIVTEEHGSQVPPSASAAITAIRAGAGVVVQEACRWDPSLARLAADLSAELHEPCRINVYATQPQQAAFPLHADTHDVLVLQIAGQKRWHITGPSLPDPLYHASLQPLPPPEDTTATLAPTLSPGDTLYIPRGHWHRALAQDGPSLHLTIAIFRTTGMDLLTFLAGELFQSAEWRAALPLRVGPAVRKSTPHTDDADHIQRLAESLRTHMADPGLLDRFHRARLAAQEPRQPFSLGAHMGAPAQGPWEAVPGPVRVSESDDAVVVHLPGRDLWLPAACASAIDVLFAGVPFDLATVMAAAPALGEAQAEAVVNDLVAEGVIRPVER